MIDWGITFSVAMGIAIYEMVINIVKAITEAIADRVSRKEKIDGKTS